MNLSTHVVMGGSFEGQPMGGSADADKAVDSEDQPIADLHAAVKTPMGEGNSFFEVDAKRGLLRGEITGYAGTYYYDGVGAQFTHSSVISNGLAELTESFTTSGEGTVTFSIAYDGWWSLGKQKVIGGTPFDPVWNAAGVLAFNGLGISDMFDLNVLNSPLVGFAEGVLSVSARFTDGQSGSIYSSLFLSMGNVEGFIDFSNTARLSYTTTAGLKLNFADADFLSLDDEPPVAPVPLPPSVLMLGAAGGLLSFVGRRNKRAGAAQRPAEATPPPAPS